MKKPKVTLENYFELVMYYRREKKISFGDAAKQAQKDIKEQKK